MNEAPQKWKSLLAMAEFWYNSYHHSSLGCCHFKALYGYEPSMHILPNPADIAQPSVAELLSHQADRHRTDRQFQVGEKVLLKLQPYVQSSVVNRPLYNS
jgi:hypothetical protein